MPKQPNKWANLLEDLKTAGSGRFKFIAKGRTPVRLVHPTGDPEDTRFFREVTNSYGRTRYLVLGYLPKEEVPAGEAPQIHPIIVPKTVLTKIISMLAEDYDFFDPDEGYGIIIIREGEGRTNTTYDVMPSRSPQPLPEGYEMPDEGMEELADLFNQDAVKRADNRGEPLEDEDSEEEEVVEDRRPRRGKKSGSRGW